MDILCYSCARVTKKICFKSENRALYC